MAVGGIRTPNELDEVYGIVGNFEEHSGEDGWASRGLARLCVDYKQVQKFDYYIDIWMEMGVVAVSGDGIKLVKQVNDTLVKKGVAEHDEQEGIVVNRSKQVIFPGVSVDSGNGEAELAEGIKKTGVSEDGGVDSSADETNLGAIRGSNGGNVTELMLAMRGTAGKGEERVVFLTAWKTAARRKTSWRLFWRRLRCESLCMVLW